MLVIQYGSTLLTDLHLYAVVLFGTVGSCMRRRELVTTIKLQCRSSEWSFVVDGRIQWMSCIARNVSEVRQWNCDKRSSEACHFVATDARTFQRHTVLLQR